MSDKALVLSLQGVESEPEIGIAPASTITVVTVTTVTSLTFFLSTVSNYC